MTLIMNLQNLQQENGMLSMIKITQNMVKEMKIIQALSLKQKLLKQVCLCVESDAYILVTGDIPDTGGNAGIKVASKNCAPFTRCVTHINDEHVDTTENRDIIMPIYHLTEYSDNYSDTSGRLWQFKIDEQDMNNGKPVTTADSSSFKYKSNFLTNLDADANGVLRTVKIAVPLKYLRNFWRSLEMSLIVKFILNYIGPKTV